MADLKLETEATRRIAEALAEANGLDADDEAVVTTALGETSAEEAMREAANKARWLEKQAEAAKEIAAEIKARQRRMEDAAQKLRDAVGHAMQELGLRSLSLPEMTLSLRSNKPSVVCEVEADESTFVAYPGYVTEKRTYAWDKTAIREAIEDGMPIDFAHLSNGGPSLQIRTK